MSDIETKRKIDLVNLPMKTKKEKNVKNEKFQFIYGNYNKYYGYRSSTNLSDFSDPRISALKQIDFQGKKCLDIGCNSGFLTTEIGKQFKPKRIVGVDIDKSLVKKAWNHLSLEYSRMRPANFDQSEPIYGYFPISFPLSNNSIPILPSKSCDFPHNVKFKSCNYLEDFSFEDSEFDLILCLSVTKWIHLNWGDEGIVNLFNKIYKNLKEGGQLILEFQIFSTYNKKAHLSSVLYKNFQEIKLKPEEFITYLLSVVGFKSFHELHVDSSKPGFNRSIFILNK